jgi:hypothetical protein
MAGVQQEPRFSAARPGDLRRSFIDPAPSESSTGALAPRSPRASPRRGTNMRRERPLGRSLRHEILSCRYPFLAWAVFETHFPKALRPVP